MNTPVTPSPMTVRAAIAKKKAAEPATEKSETDAPESGPVMVQDSQREKRKRVQDLKKKGLSIKEIADTMRLPESVITKLEKPFVPKPHLTQRIEGLEQVRKDLAKANHPAGRGRNGGK